MGAPDTIAHRAVHHLPAQFRLNRARKRPRAPKDFARLATEQRPFF